MAISQKRLAGHALPFSVVPTSTSKAITTLRRLPYVGVTIIGLLTAAIVFLNAFRLPRPHKPIDHDHRNSAQHAYDAVAPFIFDSVQGLLKQWPNSYAPNGHSIVVGTIPPHTLLYHAGSTRLLKKPTFFAFDAEMSVGIYGGSGQAALNVYATTRTLKILYLDGQSATLTPAGTLDSQMAILQRHVPVDPSYDLIYDEDQRALDLCRLVADPNGIDAIVRMNAGFEVLICDFDASQVRELFITNITAPSQDVHNESLPRDPNRQPPLGFGNVFSEQGSYEWARSATWHYGGYGGGGPSEQRVKLDVCKMVSFYDLGLTSLQNSHHGGIVAKQKYENGWGLRRGHRLHDIDRRDADLVHKWLREITSDQHSCSGIDWRALLTTINAHHGTRAKEISAAFQWEKSTESQAHAIITKIHELSHAILVSYLEYPASNNWGGDITRTRDRVISRCSSVYIALVDVQKLARSERILYRSTKVVIEKLCRWEWDLFEWSERRTTDALENGSSKGNLHVLQKEINQYRKLSENVLAWIGWDTWTECDRQCAVNEICIIPTWPVVYAPGLPQGGIYAKTAPKLSKEETLEFWRPKCIDRKDFDRGGGRGREPKAQLPDVPA
ncbi:hypothetical protein QBC43DRAFT_320337 [Cladorrhinum sp. PSN259]|nr:hypothetical protein QBC43DRAFT_320337 [Cladorrhinum sp. PSN259]